MAHIESGGSSVPAFVSGPLWHIYQSLFSFRFRRFEYYFFIEHDLMEITPIIEAGSQPEKAPAATEKWWLAWRTWPRRRLYLWLAAGLASLAILGIGLGLGLYFGLKKDASSPVSPTTNTTAAAAGVGPLVRGPVVDSNFADPCYITEGSTHYAFATNKYKENQSGQVHIQLATSQNFSTWTLTGRDALPVVGKWSAGDFVWAPDVVKLDNGTFVMYYTARVAQIKTRYHCIGAAFSANVEGPYTPMDGTLVCPLSQGGAIDPEGFRDADGSRYLIYKVDGNSLDSHNGTFHSTPLMLQKVDSDGVTLIGEPVELLDRIPSDGPLIEAPALGRYDVGDGKAPLYVLYFSSNVFTGPGYNILYATSSAVSGPFKRGKNALLKTGDGPNKALMGPGGMDVGSSSLSVVFHSIDKHDHSPHLVRNLWVGQLTINGDEVSFSS